MVSSDIYNRNSMEAEGISVVRCMEAYKDSRLCGLSLRWKGGFLYWEMD